MASCLTNMNRLPNGRLAKGHKLTPKGEANIAWKKEGLGYSGVHGWIRRNFGRATYCSNDMNHKSNAYDWANISGKYFRDINDYKQLCRKCHIEFDKKNHCSNGHARTTENCYKNKKGIVVCRVCIKVRNKLNNVNEKTRAKNFILRAIRISVLGHARKKYEIRPRTHCYKGHPFTKENTRWVNNGKHRSCRTCRNKRSKEHYKLTGRQS